MWRLSRNILTNNVQCGFENTVNHCPLDLFDCVASRSCLRPVVLCRTPTDAMVLAPVGLMSFDDCLIGLIGGTLCYVYGQLV
jgi:hypothetical protein